MLSQRGNFPLTTFCDGRNHDFTAEQAGTQMHSIQFSRTLPVTGLTTVTTESDLYAKQYEIQLRGTKNLVRARRNEILSTNFEANLTSYSLYL